MRLVEDSGKKFPNLCENENDDTSKHFRSTEGNAGKVQHALTHTVSRAFGSAHVTSLLFKH